MASRSLFQAFLLAVSLGWNGVYAQDAYSNTTSSAEQTLYAPIIGVSQTSLLVPTSVTSRHPEALTPVTAHTALSLEGPGEPSSSSTSWPTIAPSPVEQHTDTSLDVPTRPHTHTPTIAYSPATGQSETSLQVPTTHQSTPVAPIVATAKSQTELEVPTSRPTAEDGHDGAPTAHPAHGNDGGHAGEVSPGGIIASIAHQHGQQWSGQDQTSQQTTAAPTQGSTYHLMGTQLVAGASAATIDGTAYSLAPSGDGIYINGHRTTVEGSAATDSVAMALMSAISSDRATGSVSPTAESRTLATATSDASPSGSGSGTASAGAAQQTGNGAGGLVPGLGLGVVAMVVALL